MMHWDFWLIDLHSGQSYCITASVFRRNLCPNQSPDPCPVFEPPTLKQHSIEPTQRSRPRTSGGTTFAALWARTTCDQLL